MATSRIHIYFLFFLILLINGCDCYSKGEPGDPDNDDDTLLLTCANIDKVSKTITFEIHGKYHYNNEPIQNEGNVNLYIRLDNYIFNRSDENLCRYDKTSSEKKYEKKFNQNGKAIITIDEFEFDTKYDNIGYLIEYSLPGHSNFDGVRNSENGVVRYNTPESLIFNLSYISEIDDL